MTTWHYPHSPAARCVDVRRAAIDRYHLPGMLGQTDIQTDGHTKKTDGRPTDA